jgi:uncharacterized membrane protein
VTRQSDRFPAFDATRGTAMLFVLLAHFANEYFRAVDEVGLHDTFNRVGMVATPTFVVISGTMLGYLWSVRRSDFKRVKSKLLDRGLFYLIIGHMLVCVAYLPMNGSLERSFWGCFITDVIGVCLICGPTLVETIGTRSRVAVSALGFSTCWVAAYSWAVNSEAAVDVKTVLIGLWPGTSGGVLWGYVFPVLPWSCVYVGSTAIGEKIGDLVQRGFPGEVERFARRLAFGSLAIAVPIAAIWKTRLMTGIASANLAQSMRWLSGSQKTPPGPIYLMFFGGIGLLFFYAFIRWRTAPAWRPFVSVVALLGRASFFVFMLQYYVYEMLVYSLHLPYSPAWPLYFLFSITFIIGCAYLWQRKGCNRLLSFRLLLRPGRPS